MKDFQLHFVGEFDDLDKVIERAKEFQASLLADGVTLERSTFASGHFLGGSRVLSDIRPDQPANFTDQGEK